MDRILRWIQCWAGIIDGVVGVVTFTLVTPRYQVYMAMFRSKLAIVRAKRKMQVLR